MTSIDDVIKLWLDDAESIGAVLTDEAYLAAIRLETSPGPASAWVRICQSIKCDNWCSRRHAPQVDEIGFGACVDPMY